MSVVAGRSYAPSNPQSEPADMNRGISLGLSRITRLLEALGRPHLAVPIIHVAGTNGKGSVCAYIESILRTSGLRVGRFTSPHLTQVRDCITLGGNIISEDMYHKAKQSVEAANAANDISASSFELLSATAFQSFKNEEPPLDLAVVEVGMGGATDATNVCPDPLVTVITAIDMDHQAFLGNTIGEIAAVKAGIIKPGHPCVLGPQSHEKATTVVKQVAITNKAPLFAVQSDDTSSEIQTRYFTFKNVRLQVKLPLLGSYQAANAATAVKAVELLQGTILADKANAITAEHVRDGLEATRWPGRLDWISLDGHEILVDGAHNPASIYELVNYLSQLPEKPTTVIGALSSPREPASLLEPLVTALPSFTNFIGVGFTPPEGMAWVKPVDPEIMASTAKTLGLVAHSCSNVAEAMTEATKSVQHRIVICGSLYLVADVYRLLEKRQP